MLDVAYLAVLAAILAALWANYRLEVRIARLRAELERAAASAIEWELTR